MSARAGIVVTGTEVLSGIITDRNGPWLSERLREAGVECADIVIVGDRPQDLRAALEAQTTLGVDLIVTSGGLGPTADDLTAQVVAEFCGRRMVLDEALEQRIWAILERLSARWAQRIDPGAVREANRKQAFVPVGATVLEPVGTAPGLVVPPAEGLPVPTVAVLPGPPGELQPMWRAALATQALQAAISGAEELRRGMLRIFGIPESEIANTLRSIEAGGVPLERLEITTCLRRGEIEVATVYTPDATDVYDTFVAGVRDRHGPLLFSDDGSTIDEQVARLLRDAGATVATAESCTGGLLAGRLTDLPGSSAYVLGGLVVYSDAAKTALAGVDAALIERVGAVSPEVAAALADGARAALGATHGVGITGVAGPDGGTDAKPVGLVCLSVAGPNGRIDRTVQLPGSRPSVRDRTTTVALHLLRRLLLGGSDDDGPAAA
jgi:competence/damage-inducible protein CinA-like protein